MYTSYGPECTVLRLQIFMTKDKSDREKHGRDSVVDGELWKCTKLLMFNSTDTGTWCLCCRCDNVQRLCVQCNGRDVDKSQ